MREKAEVRLRQGRITFVGAPDPAGFDSVAVIYRPCTVADNRNFVVRMTALLGAAGVGSAP